MSAVSASLDQRTDLGLEVANVGEKIASKGRGPRSI